ncbi:hypothetical protein PG997_000201 [Apiospora hydei]|uniref:Uncharacterized protein n=1 Tax=Apiospora hydei TaxID=1337664 RepID=A0ABR1X9X1_9PEZI
MLVSLHFGLHCPSWDFSSSRSHGEEKRGGPVDAPCGAVPSGRIQTKRQMRDAGVGKAGKGQELRSGHTWTDFACPLRRKKGGSLASERSQQPVGGALQQQCAADARRLCKQALSLALALRNAVIPTAGCRQTQSGAEFVRVWAFPRGKGVRTGTKRRDEDKYS